MRRLLAVAALATLTTGCASRWDGPLNPNDSPLEVPQVEDTLPAPPGAVVEQLAPGVTPTPNTCTTTRGSLRPRPETRPAQTVPEILHAGRLVVGLDQGSNLFSFRDPISGTLQGFDVDIAREIARDIFGNPNRIEYRTLSSAEREHALETGLVDVIVKTMSVNCEREERFQFSTVYYRANQRVLTVQDSGITGISELDGRRVCAVKSTTSLEQVYLHAPGAIVLTVNSWADCLVALQQGQVEAISTDDAILAGLVEQDPHLTIVGDPISVEHYAVGIARRDSQASSDNLVRQVNSTLERIRADGTWDELYTRWLAPSLGPSLGPPYPVYRD